MMDWVSNNLEDILPLEELGDDMLSFYGRNMMIEPLWAA